MSHTPGEQNRRSRARSILYVCYLGVDEPLVRTQVIPYVAGLARAGHRVVLLTFEPGMLAGSEQLSIRRTLHRQGIEWHRLRYHKRPALPATLVDMLAGIVYGAYLIRKRHIDVVHARGHVPAAMAVVLKRLLGLQLVFDIRGLMADEYVDAGLWKADGILFRMTKRLERSFLAHADAVVVLTRRAKRWLSGLRELDGRQSPVEVIPCCVDPRRFDVDPVRVEALRKHLRLDGYPVMVYAGKFGGSYMALEMVDFFRVARCYFPGLRFLVLTQSAFALIEAEFVNGSVPQDTYRCLRVSPEDLPIYLALADFAVSFRAPLFSQMAASPTKMAEYLAAGLPVIYNAGIGDLDELTPERVGVMVDRFGHSDYEWAAQQLRLLLEDRSATAARCRTVAEKTFSLATVGIAGYLRLYSSLTRERDGDWHLDRTSDVLPTRLPVSGEPGAPSKG